MGIEGEVSTIMSLLRRKVVSALPGGSAGRIPFVVRVRGVLRHPYCEEKAVKSEYIFPLVLVHRRSQVAAFVLLTTEPNRGKETQAVQGSTVQGST